MISESLAFKVLSIMGCWLPIERTWGNLSKYLYYLYSTIVVSNFYLLLILESIFIFNEMKNDLNSAIETLIWTNSTLFLCVKAKLLIFDRKKILNLDLELKDELLIAKSNEEIEIHENCLKRTKIITAAFLMLAQNSSFLIMVSPILSKESGELPLKHWILFEVNKTNYLIIYAWQIFVLITGGSINCLTDCIFVDFIEHGCKNISILRHRLRLTSEVIKLSRKKSRNFED